jgi:hypothetical protein
MTYCAPVLLYEFILSSEFSKAWFFIHSQFLRHHLIITVAEICRCRTLAVSCMMPLRLVAVPLEMKTVIHPCLMLLWLWLPAGTVTELSVCGLKLLASAMLFCARVVITFYYELRCIQLLLRTFYSIWPWLLNQYDLGCMLVGLKSLVISRNLRLCGLKFGKLSASVEDFLT